MPTSVAVEEVVGTSPAWVRCSAVKSVGHVLAGFSTASRGNGIGASMLRSGFPLRPVLLSFPRVSAQCQVPQFSPTPRNNVMPSLQRNPGALRKKLSEGPHSCMQVPGWGTNAVRQGHCRSRRSGPGGLGHDPSKPRSCGFAELGDYLVVPGRLAQFGMLSSHTIGPSLCRTI